MVALQRRCGAAVMFGRWLPSAAPLMEHVDRQSSKPDDSFQGKAVADLYIVVAVSEAIPDTMWTGRTSEWIR